MGRQCSPSRVIGTAIFLALCWCLQSSLTPYFRNYSSTFLDLHRNVTGREQQVSVNQSNVHGYVTFGDRFKDGRGLGNQMFDLAVVIYVSTLTGRRPVIKHTSSGKLIDNVQYTIIIIGQIMVRPIVTNRIQMQLR